MVTELEPAETTYLEVGQSYRLHLQIVDADSKQPVDPDATYPQLIVTPPYTAPITYELGGVGSPIVRNSQGNYQADIPITLAGKNRAQYVAAINGVSVGSNTTQVEGVSPTWW